ncbi:ATP synthase F1 subunit gamma [Thermosipho melanesiensis]|uniref:ATP synthase gamma chain n=2 Tax=Thermosipho melanesiensis TaxID=46541 RepID=A6LJR2_THEM4|nr:ATP synthase F1 subunit gamma [Thermosipho melanesiensis]ABR30163.1 ATP synthase F1, gamma subunit [Thermosipho melanesiensis BI429]APT73362.1 ATP synthase F1 subunit gamma [Thermosipho melanesiensis]OOC38177.1 ATP synthase F1 subunit gamma [Thermosipho melanesiensis]OOC40098.1 ATP synthase F1 subunit gamma [Thermosipho melanesiensis]OOC40151.1 ATP synthase F1 subunit gamma [Thermosipho melanesiensis]
MSRGKLLSIKKRVQSTESLKKITKAMEMVATARVKKVEKNLHGVREFLNETIRMIENLELVGEHPFLTGEGKKGLIVISTDMGLCGAFPTEIGRLSLNFVEKKGIDYVYAIGNKTIPFFRRHQKTRRIYERVYDIPTFDFAKTLTNDLMNDGIATVYIVYGKFKNRLIQKPEVVRLTPVEFEKVKSYRYEFEPTSEEITNKALEFLVSASIYSYAYETKVSELYARQNAMRNATENAEEVIRELTLEFNKERQASITQELIEIVSGAQALQEE